MFVSRSQPRSARGGDTCAPRTVTTAARVVTLAELRAVVAKGLELRELPLMVPVALAERIKAGEAGPIPRLALKAGRIKALAPLPTLANLGQF